jgi:hypothetical protein
MVLPHLGNVPPDGLIVTRQTCCHTRGYVDGRWNNKVRWTMIKIICDFLKTVKFIDFYARYIYIYEKLICT